MKDMDGKQNDVKLTKPVVGLSAFALVLLSAGGVGSEALASNVTVTTQASVAMPISKIDLGVVSKPTGKSPRTPNHQHNNNTIRHQNNVDNNTKAFAVHGVAFAGSIPRRFDV